VYQGASDSVIPLNDMLTWYREVEQVSLGSSGDPILVLPVPGMTHCAGRRATDQFDLTPADCSNLPNP
jgi:hypothetical protein